MIDSPSWGGTAHAIDPSQRDPGNPKGYEILTGDAVKPFEREELESRDFPEGNMKDDHE